MRRLLRHLPLLMFTAILLLSIAACGKDEPRGKRHDEHGDRPTPTDTTLHNDTTASDTTATDSTHHSNPDPTDAFTITVTAPRDYGYMGQDLQLTAVTSRQATVTWRSTCTAATTVNADGLVHFNNARNDSATLIIATANNVADTLALNTRFWKVAAWNGNDWISPSYLTVHPGDTLVLTITDSKSRPINDQGFNASACQWTTSTLSGSANAITSINTTGTNSQWQRHMVIAADALPGTMAIIMAQYGDAAATISCSIAR